eukprot:Rmarinus@m.14436
MHVRKRSTPTEVRPVQTRPMTPLRMPGRCQVAVLRTHTAAVRTSAVLPGSLRRVWVLLSTLLGSPTTTAHHPQPTRRRRLHSRAQPFKLQGLPGKTRCGALSTTMLRGSLGPCPTLDLRTDGARPLPEASLPGSRPHPRKPPTCVLRAQPIPDTASRTRRI